MTSDAAQRTHSHRRDEHFPRSGWRIALVLTCIAAIAAGATTPLHGGLDFGWTPLEGRTLGVWILVAGYLAMGWMLIEATWTGDLPVPFQARYVIERRTPASRCIENTAHHCLDWSFDEDRSRIRTGYGPENTTRLRRFAIQLIKARGLHVAETLRRLNRNVRGVFDFLKMTANSQPTPNR